MGDFGFGVCQPAGEETFQEIAQWIAEERELVECCAVARVERVAREVGDFGEGLAEVGEALGSEGYVFHLAEVFEVANCSY